MRTGPRSPGEGLFAAYLRQRRLLYRFEPDVGGRKIDFVVTHPDEGDVAYEVYEPEWRLPHQPAARDPYEPIRRGFQGRKRDQAKAAATAGFPYVLVLESSNATGGFAPLIVAGAMFGNIGVTFSVQLDPEASPPADDRATTFLGGGRLQPSLNRSISAVAVLTRFNPTLWRVQGAYGERLHRLGLFRIASPPPDAAGVVTRIIIETHEHFRATGAFDPDAAVARLTVLHNPHAEIPLDIKAASGPHDEQWGIVVDDDGARYCKILSGLRCWEIPDRLLDRLAG